MKRLNEHSARRNEDGTYVFRDVVIFQECRRLNPHTGEYDVYDAAWLRDAAAKAQQDEAADRLIPVHLGHVRSYDTGLPEPAGVLRNVRDVDISPVEGTTDVRLLANITDVPEEIAQQIIKGRICDRAVEINRPAEASISSLALLRRLSITAFAFPLKA